MINVHAIGKGVLQAKGPRTAFKVQRSIGYTTTTNGDRVPAYDPPVTVFGRRQGSMSAKELAQVNALNIQGVTNVLYLDGQFDGVIRSDKKGGDLVLFPDKIDGPEKTWLIVHVLESWPTWTKVIVTLQPDAN